MKLTRGAMPFVLLPLMTGACAGTSGSSGGEDSTTGCAEDSAPIPDTAPAPVEYELVDDTHYRVVNPTSGARMMVEVVRPSTPSASVRPTVLLVPGGRASRTEFTEEGQAQAAADLYDMNYIAYDPEGRGDSDGVEDDGGSVQQDGLHAVLRFAASGVDPSIDAWQIGLISNSFGVTMAAGMLARHADAPDLARFLVDYEGPADRNDTGSCAEVVGHLDTADCADEAYWSQREARAFIDDVRIPYARLQTPTDHAQPELDHAIVMVNAALYGAAPMVVLNLAEVTAPLNRLREDQLLEDGPDRLIRLQTGSEVGRSILSASRR